MLAPMTLLAAALAAAPAPASPEEAVKAADAAMSDASRRRDAAGFLSHVADDAIFSGSDGLAQGRRAVAASWARFLSSGGPSLTWSPDRAVVASSGDLAFTVGHWHLAGPGGETAEGEYVTVWRRAGGAWRALFDAANRPATTLGPGLRRAAVRKVTSAARDLEAIVGRWRRSSRDGGSPEQGTFLTVRRRAPGGDWQIVVDAARRSG